MNEITTEDIRVWKKQLTDLGIKDRNLIMMNGCGIFFFKNGIKVTQKTNQFINRLTKTKL